MTPRYEHDCEVCQFLGQHKQFDLYYCSDAPGPMLIARYSNYPPSYISGLETETLCEPLALALDLAKEHDFLPSKHRHSWIAS